MGWNNRQSYWPRGKALGGSSAMNAMLYVRGNRQDYDSEWQQAGGSEWSWNSVLPHFSAATSTPSQQSQKTNGLLNVEHTPASEFDIYIKSMLRGMYEELGYKHLDTMYGDTFIGFGRSKNLLKDGIRHSAAKGFLQSSLIADRSNLHVIKMAHVNRLIIDKTSKRVNGVEFTRLPEQRVIKVKARKEVILSAGSINTPQILMLSGIGPHDQLKAHKIEPIHLLDSIGKNMQDHIMVPLVHSFHKSTAITPTYQMVAKEFLDYLFHQTGAFSNLGASDYMGFINTQNDTQYPDIQIMNLYAPKQTRDALKVFLILMNYKESIIDEIVAANQEADIHFSLAVLLYPKSHGQITLKNSDSFDSPKIQANYLQEIDDAKTLVRAMKILSKLKSTQTFREHEGEALRMNLELCNDFDTDSDEYWDCYVRHMMITVYHPVGTAKMGTKDDRNSVVDGQLNVRGINGLRIADASV